MSADAPGVLERHWAIATDPDYREGTATMEFRLTYEGKLMGSSSGSPRVRHKQEIRKAFHPQLRRLWEIQPHLAREEAWSRTDPGAIGPAMTRKEQLASEFRRGNYHFVPLVVEELQMLCAIRVLFLRPGKPGSILASADLDARLKTLFDALRVPNNDAELGGYTEPTADEDPFFCLLQDDKLVSHISVDTDILLQPTCEDAGEHDARLVIAVELKPYNVTWGNLGMA